MASQPTQLIYVRDGSRHTLTADEANAVDELLRHPLHNNLPYGWRMALGQRGVRVPVPHEQRTLAKIRELRALGWGRNRITNYLNKLGYPPRGRFGATRWHPRTMRDILERIDAERVSGTSQST